MQHADIELVLDAQAAIGESPTWSIPEQALYWIDVKAPALHRFEPSTGADRIWKLPDEIGCFALYEDERAALVALRSGLYRLDLDHGGLRLLAEPPYNPLRFRFNEGACDGKGRFWTGTMYAPKEDPGQPEPSPLFSYTGAGGLVRQPDACLTPNGMCWSKDGRGFFFAHSKEQSIYQFDFDAERGRIANRRLFARISERLGVPDGCAMDAEGCYWSAIHGGGRLIRYTPDGEVEREVRMPVSQPTMCAFGGPNLDAMYVTTARSGLNVLRKLTERHAGGLFRFHPGVLGLPRRGFAG